MITKYLDNNREAMITLSIDGKEIGVGNGATILEAAQFGLSEEEWLC
ncbi:hypothetical protein KKH65_03445 [bacterium]|nr:hypothetical protein [bacterium]